MQAKVTSALLKILRLITSSLRDEHADKKKYCVVSYDLLAHIYMWCVWWHNVACSHPTCFSMFTTMWTSLCIYVYISSFLCIYTRMHVRVVHAHMHVHVPKSLDKETKYLFKVLFLGLCATSKKQSVYELWTISHLHTHTHTLSVSTPEPNWFVWEGQMDHILSNLQTNQQEFYSIPTRWFAVHCPDNTVFPWGFGGLLPCTTADVRWIDCLWLWFLW